MTEENPAVGTGPAAPTEDFVHNLVRGSELLQSGDLDGARAVLERALGQNPGSERVQNLLALSYFKLGQYPQAEQIFSALAADPPSDPALRVNLGLIHLKTGRAEEAVEAFSQAVSLAPTHRKAQNYLGLAYLFQGDRIRAREWFERSGKRSMCERLAAMGDAPIERVSENALRMMEGGDARPEPPAAAGEATEMPLEEPASHPPAANPAEPSSGPAPVDAFAKARTLEEPPADPFACSPFRVVIAVEGDLFTRLDGLVAVSGQVTFAPAKKRFRGQVTDRPFGEPDRRMMRAQGSGRLWLSTGGRHFTAIEVGEDPVYLREAAVFAFEAQIPFENGRVPSKAAGDLHLVNLRGRGRVLVTSHHEVRALAVLRGQPCRVPVEALLGWTGSLVPRMVALASIAPGEKPLTAVELAGEGRVLLDAAV